MQADRERARAELLREAVLEVRYQRGRLQKVSVDDYVILLRVLDSMSGAQQGEVTAQLDLLARQVRQLPLWSPHPDVAERVGDAGARLVRESDVVDLIERSIARLREASA